MSIGSLAKKPACPARPTSISHFPLSPNRTSIFKGFSMMSAKIFPFLFLTSPLLPRQRALPYNLSSNPKLKWALSIFFLRAIFWMNSNPPKQKSLTQEKFNSPYPSKKMLNFPHLSKESSSQKNPGTPQGIALSKSQFPSVAPSISRTKEDHPQA